MSEMEFLEKINSLPDRKASVELKACCGSTQWAQAMVRSRPFKDKEELLAAADRIWKNLSRLDWLEAFSRHPRIGDFAGAREWAKSAHPGAAQADDSLLEDLSAGCKKYEEKFGYNFVISSPRMPGAELLAALRSRLGNDRQSELIISAEEQRKITRARLEELTGTDLPGD